MQKYVIALYIRLSLEDFKTESLSIPHQRMLLRSHAETLPDTADPEILEFIDNGYSGANFERPAMQELLELVRSNRIDCIIVKDFSRFGRNILETGYFIEQVFPLFRTRFISINDDFDTIHYKGDTGGMEVAFKYLISEYYSRDLSVKSKSAKYVKMRRGEYQSKICPYGYKKGPDGRMEIDPDAAAVVRLIFDMVLAGKNATQTAKALYDKKIPTPGEYKVSKGAKNPHDVSRTNGVWQSTTVLRILRDERYIGTYIMGKRAVTEVGGKKLRVKNEEEWFRIPDHHPAIINKKEFELAQSKLRSFKLPNRKTREYPLRGKVFCGCCGHAMSRANSNPLFYCRYSQVDESFDCHGLRIREKELEGILFETLVKQAQAVLAVDNVCGLSDLDSQLVQQVKWEGQVQQLQDHKRGLYEQYLLREIDLEEYKRRKTEYDADLVHVKQICSALTAQTRQAQKENAEKKKTLEAAQRISNETGLTQTLSDLLIERVSVHPGNAIEVSWKIRDFSVKV